MDALAVRNYMTARVLLFMQNSRTDTSLAAVCSSLQATPHPLKLVTKTEFVLDDDVVELKKQRGAKLACKSPNEGDGDTA